MTEKEKMLGGQYYNASDPELVRERLLAKELLYDLNRLRPSQAGEREALLRKLLGTAGENIWIEQPFLCDYGYNIHLGRNFYANHGCTVLDCAPVAIGDNVMLAPNVGIYTAAHPLDAAERSAGWEFAKPIAIGDDVWIGAGAILMPGVTIGHGTVIGAGSVVTKDIPAGVVAAGNPCRVLREL